MNPTVLFLVAMLLVIVNGFFVAVEFSLMAVRRTQMEELAESGVFGSRQVVKALGSINVQLAASQLGISVVSLLIGWLIEPVISSAFVHLLGGLNISIGVVRAIGFVIGLALVAFVHMVLGEMVPRSIALTTPETTARFLVPIHLWFVAATRPLVRALHGLGRAGTRLVGVEPIDELARSHTAAELAVLVDEASASGFINPIERDLLAGAFSFLNVRVGDVMTPSSKLVTIPHTATVGQAEKRMADSGHSRVLVMGASADQVIGFLHAKDLIALTDFDRDLPLPRGITRAALWVGPGEALGDVLLRMRRARRHVAVVLESGHMVGLVTLEDLLEAIVGDINDESDLLEAISTRMPRRVVRARGSSVKLRRRTQKGHKDGPSRTGG
ncbi:MAG: HlyC/CorC family transporter [Microthrixaceae bacterium]|nr:HlyC/CorC family transporter [Microthrixaceae bacterium]